MQVVALGWGSIVIFGRGELGSPGRPVLPAWLPASERFQAARVTMRVLEDKAFDFVAVWPDDRTVPDLSDPMPWTSKDLDGVVLVQAKEHHRCAVCSRQVFALYKAALPAPFNQLGRHRLATQCPHCAAHVDRARLSALALFAPPAGGTEGT